MDAQAKSAPGAAGSRIAEWQALTIFLLLSIMTNASELRVDDISGEGHIALLVESQGDGWVRERSQSPF